MIVSKGWALTLGVILGMQLSKLADKMPFIVNSVMEMRDMVQRGAIVQLTDEQFEQLQGEVDDDEEG